MAAGRVSYTTTSLWKEEEEEELLKEMGDVVSGYGVEKSEGGVLKRIGMKRRRVRRPRRRWEEIDRMFRGSRGGGGFWSMRELMRMLTWGGSSSDSEGTGSVGSESVDSVSAFSVKEEVERMAREVEEEGRRRFLERWGLDVTGEGIPVSEAELRAEGQGARWIWEKAESATR